MRVAVVGICGAGKSTFARALAQRLRCAHIELDAIYHQPGWTALADAALRERIATAVAEDAWVCDGNYAAVRAQIDARATDLVWLDPPRHVVMARVICRSLRRAVLREALWNGNRERVADWLDAGHPMREAWSRFAARRAEMEARIARGELAHLRVHHVTSMSQTAALLVRL